MTKSGLATFILKHKTLVFSACSSHRWTSVTTTRIYSQSHGRKSAIFLANYKFGNRLLVLRNSRYSFYFRRRSTSD